MCIQTVIRLETTLEKLLQTIFILILDSRCKNVNTVHYFQTVAIRTVIFQTVDPMNHNFKIVDEIFKPILEIFCYLLLNIFSSLLLYTRRNFIRKTYEVIFFCHEISFFKFSLLKIYFFPTNYFQILTT
jgi:hypothetical protein